MSLEYINCMKTPSCNSSETSLWEVEPNMYQLITSDIEQLKRQREEFQVTKFLSGLNLIFKYPRTNTST